MKFSKYFTKINLQSGEERVILTEGAPEKLGALIHRIHKEHFFDCWPNDWIYKTIREAFIDVEDDACDPEADIYTSDLLDWLKDNGNAYAIEYCNDVNNVMELSNIIEIVQNGQRIAKECVYEEVQNFIDGEANNG